MIFQLSKSFQLSSSQKNPQNLIQNKKKEIIFQNNYSSTVQNRTLSSLIPSKRILKLSKKKKKIAQRDSLFQSVQVCKYSFPRWFFKSDSARNWISTRSIPIHSDRFRRAATPESDLWCYSSTTWYSATAWLVPPLRSSIIAAVHLSSMRRWVLRLRNDGKETVDETTLTTFFFVPEGRPWSTRVPFLLPRVRMGYDVGRAICGRGSAR